MTVLIKILFSTLQGAQLTAIAMVVMCEVACTASYEQICLFGILQRTKRVFCWSTTTARRPNLTLHPNQLVSGMVDCGNSDHTASCNVLSWLIPMGCRPSRRRSSRRPRRMPRNARRPSVGVKKRQHSAGT